MVDAIKIVTSCDPLLISEVIVKAKFIITHTNIIANFGRGSVIIIAGIQIRQSL